MPIFSSLTPGDENMKNSLQQVADEKNRKYQYFFDKAEDLFAQNKLDEALFILDEIPKGCDEYPKALLLKSLMIGVCGDEEKSFKIFQKALVEKFGEEYVDFDEEYEPIDMNNPKDVFDCGLFCFYFFEDYEQAIEYFNISLRLKPNQDDVLHYKALSFAYLGRLKKAIKIIDKAIKINPNEVSYWNDKGVFLSKLNYLSKAHKAFDNAIKIEPNHYSWSNKASLYCQVNQFDKALYCFDRALDLDKNDLDSIIGKAIIYSELKDYEKSDEYFNRAEKIDSNDVNYLIQNGKHLLNQEKFQKSIEYFDECLKIDDEIALAWMYKAMALSQLGMDKKSEKCFKKAIELDPDSIEVFDEVFIVED